MHRVIRIVRSGRLAIVTLWALPLLGCGSLSTSSESISESVSESVNGISRSVSGSFEAMSRSSDKDGAESARERYREDVRVATRTFVESGGDETAFLRELGRIAERHGISHWEGRPETLRGIGAGAREAGLAEADLDVLLARLGQRGAPERALAQEGWQSAGL